MAAVITRRAFIGQKELLHQHTNNHRSLTMANIAALELHRIVARRMTAGGAPNRTVMRMRTVATLAALHGCFLQPLTATFFVCIAEFRLKA